MTAPEGQSSVPPAFPRTFGKTTHDRVLVVDGYGIRLVVERRHLVVSDGAGRQRRELRLPKVGHGVRRLVVIGHTGTVSLEALRWLDRTGIAFVHIDTDGTILTSTARPGLNDPRLRRAQALAGTTPVGLDLARALIGAKVAGQAAVAADQLHCEDLAEVIHVHRRGIESAASIDEVRRIEAKAALDYFTGWRDVVQVAWARRDHDAVPVHWRHFDGRRSSISAPSAIRATDPVNALLNYLYALAEVECRLACLTLGLDPGLGIIHADSRNRDSLALDLIEPLRPQVDAYIIDLLDGHTFRASDFHETDDGHCRILPPLTHRLAESLDRWRTIVAPIAENVAHGFADASPYPIPKPTPLTAARRGARPRDPKRTSNPLGSACQDCGTPVDRQRNYCPKCWPAHRQDNGLAGSEAARAQLTSPEARILKGETVRNGKATAKASRAADIGWNAGAWDSSIAPKLSGFTTRQIAEATGLSIPYANRIRRGTQVPDPRHWQAIADLVGTSS
jgi:CRISPR-associated endonuclease Cas1